MTSNLYHRNGKRRRIFHRIAASLLLGAAAQMVNFRAAESNS